MLSVGNVQDESWEHSRQGGHRSGHQGGYRGGHGVDVGMGIGVGIGVGMGWSGSGSVGGLALDFTVVSGSHSLCISGGVVFSASAAWKGDKSPWEPRPR